MASQSIEEWDLGSEYELTRRIEIKIAGVIDFRKFTELAGAGRPFALKGVAGRRIKRIQFIFNGPGMHGLAALLADRTQRDEGPRSLVQGDSDLLLKFPQRGGKQILPAEISPFGMAM